MEGVIVKHHLYEMSSLRDWAALVARLDTRGTRTPADLGRIRFSDLSDREWKMGNPDMLLWLWQGGRHAMSDLPIVHPRHTPGAASDLQALILPLTRDDIRDTEADSDYVQMKLDFNLPSNFELLPQAGRLAALQAADMPDFEVIRFCNRDFYRNTIRAIAGSMRSAASGMQSYLNFCQFAGRMTFAIQVDTVLLRSAMFKPGRTFAQYISHIMKAAILMRESTDWMWPAIRSVARGLANAQNLSFKFQNYVFASDLLRLLKFAKLSTELGKEAFLSFALLLRVPSETLL